MRHYETKTAVFYFEYPVPGLSEEVEWVEVEYEVDFDVDPGEPVSWDCPGAAPAPSDVRDLRQDGVLVPLSESWPGWEAMEAAIESEMEDVYCEAPRSHRFYY